MYFRAVKQKELTLVGIEVLSELEPFCIDSSVPTFGVVYWYCW